MAKIHITEKLELTLSDFFSTSLRSIAGAANAWRGFMLQALYISKRVADYDETSAYLPESVEDLLIVHNSGEEDEWIEFVQIKSLLSSSLSLSNLNPKSLKDDIDKDDSFFGHVFAFWKRGFNIEARIVVFGSIGKEMENAYYNLRSGGSLRKKMVREHGYPDEFCEWLRLQLRIEQVDETSLDVLLTEALDKQIETAAAPDLANSFVMNYMYQCCRKRARITSEIWNEKLYNFGMQASSARGYLGNYGQTIIPMSEYIADNRDDLEALELAYRSGAAATPNHIFCEFDIPRPKWQLEINKAFRSNNVVVVRAPSGQGKSTICYRWLMELESISRVYLINGVTSVNAPGIAAALRGLAGQGENCYAYIEADSDSGWVELCREIGRLSVSNLRLLVSVREDDVARAGYDASKSTSVDIFLRFDKEEAADLYGLAGTDLFPSFESAWEAFGEEGPLMEFIYSLNHHVKLREKLKGQVECLRMAGNDSLLVFLYLASKAGELGLSSSIVGLKEESGCDDVQKILATLEDELLIRTDEEKGQVFPLHPHRSKLLVEIIEPMLYEDEEELILSAAKCAQGDFSPILVPYLAEHTFSEKGLTDLLQISRRSWKSAASALRAMVWKDARGFYSAAADIRDRMADRGLPVLLGSMLACAISVKPESDCWKSVLDLIRDENRKKDFQLLINELSKRQADFQETDRLLSGLAGRLPSVDLIDNQASDAGFVLAYIGERGFKQSILYEDIEHLTQSANFESITLDAALDLLVGFDCVGADVGVQRRGELLSRICVRDNIIWICVDELVSKEVFESDGEPYDEVSERFQNSEDMVHQVSAIVAPIIEGGFEMPRSSSLDYLTTPNDIVMRAICDIRRLFPDRGRYCVKYSGIKALVGGLDIPDCEKNIPEENLQLNWTKLIYKYYYNLCKLDDNLADDWSQLEESLKRVVDDSIKALKECSFSVDAMLANKNTAADMLSHFEADAAKAKEELDNVIIDLPRCAYDPFAFSTGRMKAFIADADPTDLNGIVSSPAFGIEKGHESVLKATRDFFFSLQNHYNNIKSLIFYTMCRCERPSPSVMVNIAQACAKAEGCDAEFSMLFDEKQLISEKQKETMLQHAVYCNYLWCRQSTKIEKASLAKQESRIMALRGLSERLVRKLSVEKDVFSASVCELNTISVSYAADADIPFSDVVLRCIRSSLKYDPDSENRFVERWMLCNGAIDRIEVKYVSGKSELLKKTFRFDSLINNLNDAGKVDAIALPEIVFDETNIVSLEEAVVSVQAAMSTCEVLVSCFLEVSDTFAERDPPRTQVVGETWERWRNSISESISKLCAQIRCVVQMYPAYFDGCMADVDEFELKISNALGTRT